MKKRMKAYKNVRKRATALVLLLIMTLLSVIPVAGAPEERYAQMDFEGELQVRPGTKSDLGNNWTVTIDVENMAEASLKTQDGNTYFRMVKDQPSEACYAFLAWEDKGKTLPDRYILQFDVKLDETVKASANYELLSSIKRTESGFKQQVLLRVVASNGSLILPGDVSGIGEAIRICELSSSEFINLAVLFDDAANCFSVYANEVLVVANIAYSTIGYTGLPKDVVTGFRFGQKAKLKTSLGFCLDNIRVYSAPTLVYHKTVDVIRYVGCQESKITDGVFDVRYIATVNSLEYSCAGYRVTVSYQDGEDTHTADYSTVGTAVYESVWSGYDSPQEVTADSYGGQWLVALPSLQLPADRDITVEISPYIELDGMRAYGQTVVCRYLYGVWQSVD